MNVKLISKPSVSPDYLCGLAASICTGSDNPDGSLKGSMASGHESVAEHACFTFLVTGISRVLLAQLTRHRLASFSVQSQRYMKVEPAYVVPETIAKDLVLRDLYHDRMNHTYEVYRVLLDAGVPEEDARYVLPQGFCCDLMVTMNARELRHFFALRSCNRAQWEIRDLSDLMYALVKQEAPTLFKDAGPGCVRGHCPEGRRSCGKPKNRS